VKHHPPKAGFLFSPSLSKNRRFFDKLCFFKEPSVIKKRRFLKEPKKTTFYQKAKLFEPKNRRFSKKLRFFERIKKQSLSKKKTKFFFFKELKERYKNRRFL